MSKFVFLVLLLLIVLGGVWVGNLIAQKSTLSLSVLTSSPISTQSNISSPTPEVAGVNVAVPLTLRISKINVNTSVESVGQDNEGKMDVPKNYNNVAWYNLGVKPGDRGNAVLSGHFDTQSGNPAVFYYLNNLQIGDEIEVFDGNNNLFRYRVTNKAIYPENNFPLQEVFGATDKYRLNLITCDGTFNQASRSYSHRSVVYSELVR